MDEEFRLRFIGEILGKDEEALAFIHKVKGFTSRNFPDVIGCLDFGDPAAAQRKDTGSTLSILASEGIDLIYMSSSIEEGVRRVRFLLERIIKGIPAITISRRNCPLTVRMFGGGYHLASNGRPKKDGFYDHIADEVRYGILNLFDEHGRPNGLPGFDRNSEIDRIMGTNIPESIEYQGE